MPENSFEREVLDRLMKIEAKLDGFENAKAKTYENEKEIVVLKGITSQQQEQIDELRDRNKWLSRTVGAAIITIVIASICFAIKLGAM